MVEFPVTELTLASIPAKRRTHKVSDLGRKYLAILV